MWWKRRVNAERKRFAALRAMAPEDRAAALGSAAAADWVETAAQYGLVEAQVLLGQLHLERRMPKADPVRGVTWFRAAASAGYAPAMNMLGRCLENGWGVAQDSQAAARWFARAAEAGLDWGQYNLGCTLLYGSGMPRDRVAAFDWFAQAAGQGLAKAMNMLGRFHEHGLDRPADLVAAEYWYRRGAEAGDFRARYNVATLLAQRGERDAALALFAAAIAEGSPDFLRDAAAALDGSGDAVLQALADRARASCTPSSTPSSTMPHQSPYRLDASEPPRLSR